MKAWKSRVGDESTHVEHALMLQDTAPIKEANAE
jgi:hypothetical protein